MQTHNSSKRRRDILAAIQTLRHTDRGVSYRNLAMMTGYSYSDVRYHIHILRTMGYIAFVGKRENTITLTEWQTY